MPRIRTEHSPARLNVEREEEIAKLTDVLLFPGVEQEYNYSDMDTNIYDTQATKTASPRRTIIASVYTVKDFIRTNKKLIISEE